MKYKHICTYSLLILVVVLSACGPSEEEKQQQEQARQDSLEQVRQQRLEQQRQDSLGKVQANSQENKQQNVSFSENGSFAIQTGSWRSQAKARTQVKQWKERGFENASVIKHGNENTGDVWFRIRLGRLDSRQAAEKFQQTLRDEYQTESWISVI